MIIYHFLITALLGGYLLSLLINLFVFRTVKTREFDPKQRFGSEPVASAPPLVSILVPARNEERCIGPCAASLACQRYPNFEVLVMDDHSEDQTVSVLRGVGFNDEGPFRILSSKPLPEGWTGKAWACQQLAAEAKGEYLLFVDADTEHHPTMLASALSLSRETDAALLSAWPFLKMGSWSEKLVLPIIHLSLVFYPFAFWEWLQDNPHLAKKRSPSAWRGLGAANGQFLLFKRSVYEQIGGHACVKQHMVEDVALGREIASRVGDGLRLVNCDGSQICSVRMYSSLKEVWEGFTKNARAVFEGRLSAYLFTGLLVNCSLLLPFFLLPFVDGWAQKLVVLQICLI